MLYIDEQFFNHACIITLIISLGLLTGKLICGFQKEPFQNYAALMAIAVIMFAISWKVTDFTSACQVMGVAFIGWLIGSWIDSRYERAPIDPDLVQGKRLPRPRYEGDLVIYDGNAQTQRLL